MKIAYNCKLYENNYKSELISDGKTSIYREFVTEIKSGSQYYDENIGMTGKFINKVNQFYKNFEKSFVYSNSNVNFAKDLVIVEPLNFRWKIDESQIKIILGHKCFLATMIFKDRNYSACYAEDLKIKDGPRKYSGLPGIILEISESENRLSIKATNIEVLKKNKEISTTLNIDEALSWNETIKIAKNKYQNKIVELRKQFGDDANVKIDFNNQLEKYDLN